MKKDALILGGGIAGLACAWELARLGLESTIVETAAFAGGHVARLCCKATDECRRCGACLLEDVLHKVGASKRITILPRSDLLELQGESGDFRATVSQRPARIVSDRCNDCGACEAACPVPGALVRSPWDRGLSIDERNCLCFPEGSCRACQDACPQDAFNLDRTPEILELNAATIVLASGFKASDPHETPRFGYGRVPGVVTGLEVESLVRQDNWELGPSRKIAFIQCVGSRDAKIGRTYCSRVCCGYALRLARLLRNRFPDLDASIFYMDIQSFERDFDKRLKEAEQDVKLVRSIPSEIRKGADGRPELVYQGIDDKREFESFDLVILSVGISPSQSSVELGSILGTSLNVDGFIGADGEAAVTSRRGVFVAGTVQGPKSIEETVSHAIRASGEVASCVSQISHGENE
ncbi:MAG: FAD-dependent oxidoreductase [Desulfomonilaceae bacterium]